MCATERPISPPIKSTIAKYPFFGPGIRVSLLVLAPVSSSISSRSGLLNAERYQALINQFSPVVHRVFRIAPLQHAYLLHPSPATPFSNSAYYHPSHPDV